MKQNAFRVDILKSVGNGSYTFKNEYISAYQVFDCKTDKGNNANVRVIL